MRSGSQEKATDLVRQQQQQDLRINLNADTTVDRVIAICSE
jgi:hypothetical protein